ncbi:MAG: polymerase family protein [Rhodopila sp.]|nr:polymerase family protein [Rhodopila sp.]
MRRVVSVWFPTLPTDRLRRPEESQGSALDPQRGHAPFDPTPLSHGSKGHGPWRGSGQRPDLPLITAAGRVLMSVDAVAAGLGLRPGMKLAQAQSLVPGLTVHDADPAGDAAVLTRLAEECLRYAPLAAPDPPDGLWIDVTGSTHLHGGEARLLRDLLRRLNDQGLAARAAVADTPAVAHAVARFGGGGMVPPGAAAMADFPIEALRLPAEMLADLRLMGFERVGPLAAAARAPLVRRFGTGLAVRLDQAAGTVFEPIVPVVPPALIQARLAFVEPLLTAEAFSSVIVRLVDMVCGDLERAGLGARKLDLLFERVDGSVQAIRIGTARPGRDARHLGRMLDERLERVDPGLGVEAMRLVVAASDPLGFVQTASSLVAEASPDIAPLVDRLANRLGEAQVYRIAPVESDVPERSVRRVPAVFGSRVAASRDGGWPADLPRPVRLLDPPQPIDAMALLPDHPPIAFTWRRVRHRVRHADGPERIAGEWWKRDREWISVRDYFRVEDEDGRRFWLFRRGNGSDADTGDMRWFLHGVF